MCVCVWRTVFFRCTCVQYVPCTGVFFSSVCVCLCLRVCVSLCVQECALFVNVPVYEPRWCVHARARVQCIGVCVYACTHAPMNLSVRVAVLALYDRVWIIRSSGAIKPRAVRQDGSRNDHREAVLLFPGQPSLWEAEELLLPCLQGPEG